MHAAALAAKERLAVWPVHILDPQHADLHEQNVMSFIMPHAIIRAILVVHKTALGF